MNRRLTYFASDFHLGASYIEDPRKHEQSIVNWLKSIATECKTLFLVGDILDYWYEYKTVVPKGFVRFFGQLAEMADSGTEIVWFIGNHDIWIFDYLPKELGIKIFDGNMTCKIDGKTFFISHGDGLGKLPKGFKFIRCMFRNKILQKMYSALHPGLTVPFAHGWSAKSRKGRTGHDGKYNPDTGSEIAFQWAKGYCREHPDVDYIVIGHYHDLAEKKVGNGCKMVILGDWITKFSYAVFDGKDLRLGKYN